MKSIEIDKIVQKRLWRGKGEENQWAFARIEVEIKLVSQVTRNIYWSA